MSKEKTCKECMLVSVCTHKAATDSLVDSYNLRGMVDTLQDAILVKFEIYLTLAKRCNFYKKIKT